MYYFKTKVNIAVKSRTGILFCKQLHKYKFKVKLKLISKLLSWSFQFSLGTVLPMLVLK